MAVCCLVAMGKRTEITLMIFISDIEEISNSEEYVMLTIVAKGGVSRAVKCPNGTVFESVSKTCKPGNHSNALGCQLYCNPDFKTFYSFPNNFAECPYPEQFSDVTHRCENFTKVACGSRPQVKDYCEYFLKKRFE